MEQSFRVLLDAAAWRRARPGVLRIDIVVQTVLGVSAVVLVVAVMGASGSGGNAAVQSSSLARRDLVVQSACIQVVLAFSLVTGILTLHIACRHLVLTVRL